MNVIDRRLQRLVSSAAVLLALVAVPTAFASEILAENNVRNPTLKVTGRVTHYSSTRARTASVGTSCSGARSMPSGTPTSGQPQTKFKIDYSGGWGAFHKANYWQTFRNACTRYDGPALVGFVAGCKAPDGSYWALQRWVRLEAMRGFAPFKKEHTYGRAPRFSLDRSASGLEVWPNWTYGGDQQGFFGRLTYDGKPVYGTAPSPTVTDLFTAQRLYRHPQLRLWKRLETGYRDQHAQAERRLLLHVHRPVAARRLSGTRGGYPSNEPRGPGLGDRHRLTVMGPGVTPVVRWEGARLGAYDRMRDARDQPDLRRPGRGGTRELRGSN